MRDNIAMKKEALSERLRGPCEARGEQPYKDEGGEPEALIDFLLACLAEYDDRHEYIS